MARTPARLLLYSLRTSITLLRLSSEREREGECFGAVQKVSSGVTTQVGGTRLFLTVVSRAQRGTCGCPATRPAQSFSATLARMTIKSGLETGQTDQRPGFHHCKSIVPSREPD